MKRLLLFSVALSVSLCSFGQNVNHATNLKKETKTRTIVQEGQGSGILPVNKNKANVKGTVSSVSVSSSANVYGYLVENQSSMTANEDLGVIGFTHRANPAVLGASSGDIVFSQSRDGGDTWSQIMAFPNASGYNNRYPGGVIYNPTGNTNPDNAYAVVVGPSHDGISANVWQHAFLGSFKLDSTNIDHQYVATNGAIVRNSLTGTSNGKFYVISSNYQSSPYSLDTLLLYEGTWNSTSNTVDWTTNKFDHNFVIDAAGDEAAYIWDFKMAWSDDGQIGYYYTLGRDSSNDVRSYQPIVWKTTNGGTSWAKLPIYDFSNNTVITDELRTMMGTTIKRPQFTSAIDGVVDNNGDLHLIAKIASGFSNHDDSLGYSFTQTFEGLPGHNTIFDVFTTSTGWDAVKLGYVWTIDVADADSPYGSGADAIGWDLRLQASKTSDGTKVFGSWTDTDTSFALTNANGFPMNTFPDFYAAGYDIVTGKRTPATNFTASTAAAGDIFFHYTSDVVFSNNGVYNILATELDLGTTPLDPVNINFLKGMEFMDADFVMNPGFNKTNINNIATVSQNRPNPFNGNTQIEVNLKKSTNMSIDIINITGQVVYTRNYGKTNAGIHNLSIDGSNLTSGVYFYTVKVGEGSITKKMIVR